jgi:hypothetical protein
MAGWTRQSFIETLYNDIKGMGCGFTKHNCEADFDDEDDIPLIQLIREANVMDNYLNVNLMILLT